MAFVCTLHADPDIHVEGFRREGTYSILIHIGHDDCVNRNYFAVIGLTMMAGDDKLEYYFHILERNGDSGETRAFWSGREVAEFICPGDRALVLEAVLTGTKFLLDLVKPECVVRVTHDANLPPPALEKHYEISRVFRSCGYRVIRTDPYHGKQCWIAERVSPTLVETAEAVG